MDLASFHSAVVQLVVALVVALAARGFIQAKTSAEREAEYVETAGVLAAASVAATFSLGCLLTGYDGLLPAAVAAFGLAIAWGSLISSYFMDARKKLGKRGLVDVWARRKVFGLLLIAVLVPLAGAVSITFAMSAQQVLQR